MQTRKREIGVVKIVICFNTCMSLLLVTCQKSGTAGKGITFYSAGTLSPMQHYLVSSNMTEENEVRRLLSRPFIQDSA